MSKDLSKLFSNVVWSCEPEALEAFYAELGTYIEAGVKGDRSRTEPATYTELAADGTLNVSLKGMMLSSVPEWFAWFGIEATGTRALTSELQGYLGRRDVNQVVVNVDSPGGDISGVQRLADVLGAFTVPVEARIEGMAASAAYWAIAGADSIVASDVNDKVGSIGVLLRVTDVSRNAKNAGVDIHLLRSGANKGVGMGAPITPDNLAVLQDMVNATADTFKATVMAGRNLTEDGLQAVSDGRVFTAQQGLANGLVDRIETASDLVASSETMPALMLGKNEEGNMADTFDAKSAIEALQSKLAAMETRNNDTEAKAKAAEEKATKLEAELALKNTALAQVEATAKASAIDEAVKAGKILPAMKATFTAVADKLSAEDLTKHLAALPVLLHRAPDGQTPKEDPSAEAVNKLSEEDRKVMRLFGLDEKAMLKADKVKAIGLFDGKAKLADGSVVKLSEVK